MASTHPIGALYNSLTAGSKIIGKVIADSDFRVDGIIEGDIQCKGKIVIGEKGAIQGDMTCQNADILGCVEGSLKVENTLALRATGSINGDVQTKVLIVEPKAQFNGSCSMKQEAPLPPKEDKKPEAKKEEPKKPEPKPEPKKEEPRKPFFSLKKEEPKKPEIKVEDPKQPEPKQPEPKPEPKKEEPQPVQPKAEAPVLAVNESSIGNGQDNNIITFIDDEPEIVAVEA